MEAVIFALIAFFGWGFGDLFVTITSRKLNAYSATFWSYLISVLLLSFYIPFAIKDLQNLTLNTFLINILLGAILLVGIISFREALIKGSSPIIVVIANSYAAVTTILSLIFFQEKLSLVQSLCILIVFTGVFLSVIDIKKLLAGRIYRTEGVFFALTATLFWGIYFAFIRIPVGEIGWFWPNYFSFLFFIPVVFWWIKYKKIKLNNPNYNYAFAPLLIGVFLSRLSDLGFNAGIESGYTSIVATIAGASPILFLLLAWRFLKDPVTKQQLAGIVITLAGVILLSILSV